MNHVDASDTSGDAKLTLLERRGVFLNYAAALLEFWRSEQSAPLTAAEIEVATQVSEAIRLLTLAVKTLRTECKRIREANR